MNIPNWFAELSPALQALLATLFTWAVTASGAAVVFLFRSFKQSVLDTMLGFAAGVMIAASFWSLLVPAIELAEEVNVLLDGCRLLSALCWEAFRSGC
jgi:ZIP family zinc transporter